MEDKDFFEIKEDENEIKELKNKLSELSKKVKKLQEGKETEWKNTEIFKNIINLIGEYAPIKLIEEILSHYNEKKQKLIKEDLLSIMDEGCISSMVLDDGTKLNVKTKLKPNVTNEIEFYKWIEENGYSDFVKETLAFGKGEFDNEIMRYLDEKGIDYERTSGIHYQTLTKIFNERKKAGEQLPDDKIVKIDIFRYVDVK